MEDMKEHSPERYQQMMGRLARERAQGSPFRDRAKAHFTKYTKSASLKGVDGVEYYTWRRFGCELKNRENRSKKYSQSLWTKLCKQGLNRTDKFGRKTCPIVGNEKIERTRKHKVARETSGADHDTPVEQLDSQLQELDHLGDAVTNAAFASGSLHERAPDDPQGSQESDVEQTKTGGGQASGVGDAIDGVSGGEQRCRGKKKGKRGGTRIR